MSILIEELKKEHSEILAALNEVKVLGILSKEGQYMWTGQWFNFLDRCTIPFELI